MVRVGKKGSYNACGWVDVPREDIDGFHMGGLVIPRAVFAPVRRGNFIPRVVESAVRRKDLHLVYFCLPIVYGLLNEPISVVLIMMMT